MGVDHKPDFRWWVQHMLKQCDSITALVKKCSAKYLKCTHKFSIECPKIVEDALELDKWNCNTMWADAIAKEMKNVRMAFNSLEDGTQPPIGYQFVRCHMIFNVKMEGFCQKIQLVVGGHFTDVPPIVTYASVVLCKTVCIALTMAALNAF